MDWLAFLDRQRIPYRLEGRHQIRIDCPWCREQIRPRLTINLEGRGYLCWKEETHRGRLAARLVAALAHISLDEARQITGEQHVVLDHFAEKVSALLNASETSLPELKLPAEFKSFRPIPSAEPFIRYLEKRGFKRRQILRFTEDYGVYYATHGTQHYRVVFTVRSEGQLRAWTGRAINPTELRYLTSPTPPSITDYLLWGDDLHGGDAVALVEGPMDALRLRLLGLDATCCFTSQPTRAQLAWINDLFVRYRRRYLILDQGTLPTAMHVEAAMRNLAVKRITLPEGYKDPAELPSLDLLHLT